MESGGGWVFLEARLDGGAPWGFTLQGGLEHGEPLIISKVEVGGKAHALQRPLLVGDELISINGVDLTGFRQDAIALVKGSHKTLHVTVRRELHPGHTQDHSAPPPPPPPASPPPPPRSRTNSAGGVQLRINNRRSEPASRPHSWHSTKLGDGRLESTDAMSSAWHHSFTASASDLSAGFDASGGCLRKSPDQYSSRGSMESLDPPPSSQLHPGTPHHHPLGHHTHSGSHPTYSSCHQLSSARSSNSIDLLHNKRDSAYSSFSTSSSIPEYLTSAPSFSTERSYSLETVPQRGGGGADVQQADVRYFRTAFDAQQEQELNCTSRGGGAKAGPNQHLQGSGGGICYRGSSSGGSSTSKRHSVGPIWGPTASRSSYESLKGAPAPPRRSDSYAAIRNHERHERPNSWSSLDHARSLRSLQKGSWHHSSGCVSSGSAKASYSAEGQLHTVIEKSPESSPTTKPRQGGGGPQTPSPPSSQLILPTGMFPGPPPEPHLGPAPGASGVYPTPTREDYRQQHQGPQGVPGAQGPQWSERPQGVQGPQGAQWSQGSQVRWDEAEGWRDGGMSTVENGYQTSTSPQTLAPTSAKLWTQEADRTLKDEADFGSYRPYQKAPVGGSEAQTNGQRLQNNSIHINPGSQNQMFHEQIQEFHSTKIHQTHGLRPPSSQDWKDSYTTVESRHRSRSLDQPNVHPETRSSSRVAQGQVPPPHLPVHPQPPAPPSSVVHMPPYHHSISAVPHQPPFDQIERDREHPLTRLEIALAEVQRCDSPFSATSTSSCHGNSGFTDISQSPPARSLSVLEKVSRFEHRERAVKQRSHSTKANHHRINEKSQNTSCGAEDLRNMLERSTNGSKAHRTLSYRGGNNHFVHRTSADPSSALQRSRSSFHLDTSRVDDVNKDLPQRQDIQELILQDTSTNRSYQDSLKDAQSKVHPISVKRRDVDSSSSPSPPAAPPLGSSSSSQQPPPVPTKYHSLEKKGPKTLPKPQGVIIPPTSPLPLTSPHVPKERHVVSPEVRGPSPPALPSVPPVGPPPLMRICGRKRLMADQKKRSYSEPENMNEVGVSDTDTAALFRRAGDTSVADRRKMFELAASCVGGGDSHRTDLRQLQQDALFDYVERKRGVRRDDMGTKVVPRPRSAYIQPEHANSHSDSISLSSTYSRFSLQDCGPDRSLSSGDDQLCSTLSPGSDRRSFQSNLFYPGRVTSPRPPAHLPASSPDVQVSSFHRLLDLSPEGPNGQRVLEPRLGPSRQLNGALQRVGPGKSASAEDLLECSDQRQINPQHCRSRSSPTMETLNQDIRTWGVSVSDPGPSGPCEPSGSSGPCCLDENSTVQSSYDPGSSAVENCSDPGSVHPPVNRRDRQRTTERQRAHSTSTLAASVGLVQGGGGAEWKASERLSQANLDAITFPGTGARTRTTGDEDGGRHVGSPDSGKDSYRGRAFSLETRPERSDPFQPLSPPAEDGATHPPSIQPRPPPVQPRPSSLRISESALQTPLESGLSQDYSDEVFIPNPAPPSSPPIRETDIMEDLPLAPPPPVDVDQEAPPPTESSPSLCFRTSPLPLPQPRPSSPLSAPPTSTRPLPVDHLDLDYEPLPQRQKTPEELRVERLARQLVRQDRSLAPLLDTWGGKSTVEVMEEIFPNSKILGRSPWQRRGSSQSDDRIHDGVDVCTVNLEDEDEDQKSLNTRKVELCVALRSSVEVLKREREALQEEVKAHEELGVHVETLVQQTCTAYQADKYSMFIGDLERIVNLLLSLCGRMARIDRSLRSLQMGGVTEEGVAEERDCLLHKRSQLLRQTEDARELKENLERRQRTVHAFLTATLSRPQLLHYRRFIATKPSLLIRQRRLDDLIRQGEDQLTRLTDELPELLDMHGDSRACPPSHAPCSSLFPQLIPGPAHIIRSPTVTSL